MTGKTGQKCPRSGIWKGNCPDKERIALSVNETFPPCKGYRQAVLWTLEQST